MTTETTTTVTCDRCGQTAEVYQRDVEQVALPFRWVNLARQRSADDPAADTMDLCPDCADSFEAWRASSVAPAVHA